MMSLHDEVSLSPEQVARRALHRVLTGTRVAARLHCDNELASLLKTRREYRMQEMCVQYSLASISLMRSSLPKQSRRWQVRNFVRAEKLSSRTPTE
jgi:hypothetical protein